MARIPQVTRTIKSTNAKVLFVNILTKQTEVHDIVLPRTFKDDNEMLKTAIKLYSNDTLKVVAIDSSEVVEKHYSMLETDFIKNATVKE